MQSQQKPSSNDFKRQRCVVAAERPRQHLCERPSHALAIHDQFAHGAQAAAELEKSGAGTTEGEEAAANEHAGVNRTL